MMYLPYLETCKASAGEGRNHLPY